MLIRRESEVDVPASRALHAAAFAREDGGEPLETALLDGLRTDPAWLPKLSVVAELDGAVVGHVVCTRGWVDPGEHPALGLGPIAVEPRLQRLGVGKALMHGVLAAAEALDEPLVALLGSPDYYHRFGFEPSTVYGIEPPRAEWAQYFQVRALAPRTQLPRGVFRYAPPFDVA